MARQTVIRGDDDEEDEGRDDKGASPSSKRRDKSDAPRPSNPGQNLDLNDEAFDEQLRPQRLADVVGQRKAVERLQILIDAARLRQEPLGHLLLDGPPGLGKTTFATVLPKELDTVIQITSGPVLTAPKDLLPYLTNGSRGSILFIDEIHRLPATVEEFIYPVMEDFRVDITLGEGLSARTINMPLEPFTVIGATTRSGMLSAPLRDRFVNRLHLDFYSEEDLTEIISRNARKLRVEIAPEAAFELARRARGTPRIANNLLHWVRDFAVVKAKGKIELSVAEDALAMQEVDKQGLDEQDRKYMLTLLKIFAGGPAGIQSIAHSLNLPVDTLEDEVEPFLLRLGFIQRTPRGRILTNDGLAHLGLPPPEPGKPGRLF